MKSEELGSNTSVPEVTNVSQHGFWVLLDEREVFVSSRQFPWFADATIAELSNLERPVSRHPFWPALDIDLHLDSIESPDSFPLVSGARPDKSHQRTRSARR